MITYKDMYRAAVFMVEIAIMKPSIPRAKDEIMWKHRSPTCPAC
jgi:hypothetical protein